MNRKLVNFVAFQACWFANVLAAAEGMPWAGPIVTMVWLAVHFAALGSEARADIWLVLTAAVMGWLADSTLVLANLIAFPEPAQLGAPSTVWMVALWAGFAATLRHALGWLRGRWVLGAVLGAICGPLAYVSGEALGALTLGGTAALLAVTLQYALVTPLFLAVARISERNTSVSCCDAPRGVSP